MYTKTQMNIQELLKWLEVKEMDNKSRVVTKADIPDDIRDFIMNIHGTDLLPDDFRYSTIHSLLYDMSHHETIESIVEEEAEIIDGQIDIYTANLTGWLGSNNMRHGYVTAAQEEGLCSKESDILNQIQSGQYLEIQEIFGRLVQYLQDNQ